MVWGTLPRGLNMPAELLKFLQTPTAQAVIWITVLVILIAVGAFVVLKFRDRATNAMTPSSDLLTNFREIHHQGELSESEFRTIKTMLGAKLQGEIKGGAEKGSARPND